MKLTDPTCPIVVARAARLHGLPLAETTGLCRHAIAGNLTAAAIRLVPPGQTEGQRCLAALAPLCLSIAHDALTRTVDDLGANTFLADIASMKHETRYARLFHS